MTEQPDLAALLAAHRAARGGAPLLSPAFPEQVGPFQLFGPDPARGKTEWSMADGAGWLPVLLADRDTCLLLGGWLLAADETAPTLKRLRDRFNRATPSVAITVEDFVREVAPEALETDDEDEEEPK